jgi:hypothetical protein
MEFFCYHRDRPGSVALRDELLEDHRSYMDGYQAGVYRDGPNADLAVPADRDELIAYGPLLSDNGATWLGTAGLVRARTRTRHVPS